MKCEHCGHHTWHVDRSVHEESVDHNKLCNVRGIRRVQRVLDHHGLADSPSWHYRRRKCRRCGEIGYFVEMPIPDLHQEKEIYLSASNPSSPEK
tara:strand:- start:89 stop:370 length:282 start_codon:yes stop_codon:yes gene_type:complete